MKKWISLFISIACLYSCIDKSIPIKFPEEKTVSAIKIPIEEVFSANFMTKKSNYLTFISIKSDTMIYFYSFPDLKFVTKMGIKGKGPDEFLLPMFVETSNDDLCLWGYSNPLLIKQFSLNANVNFQLINEFHLKRYEAFNQMHIVQDSIFVYSTLPMEYAIKLYDLKNSRQIGKIKIEKDNNRNSSLCSNRGIIAANDSCIVYVYNYKRRIDLYDIKTLELKKTLKGNYNFQKPRDDYQENINYYLNVVAGKECFYALYRGDKYKNIKKNAIEVFDYNGNPIIKYHFDIAPNLFYVDEANGVMYGYVYKYPDAIFKYLL